MSVTTLVSLGTPFSMTQNVVYALPARAVRIQSTAVVQISPDGSTWDNLTNSETVGADAASAFVRCAGGNCVAVFKPY